ncbi:MAG: galactose mutarotase [Prevotella sp.]|nr:galactose mutarotase [Prevotella sp.]
MKTRKASLLGAGAIMALALASCDGQSGQQLTLSGLDAAKFDTVINEKPVGLYTLTNEQGMEVCVTNFGGRVVSIMVPDRDGKMTDVVLGYDNIAQYADAANFGSDFGASIGRYANRIKNGQFTLNDSVIQLPQNNFGHCLHGGPTGWQYQVYEAQQVDPQTLKLTLVSPDGDNQFPGQVTATVTYTLTAENALDIKMEAETDAPTIVNMTNHSYFNLNGDPTQPAMDMVMYINADKFTPADSTFMPTGEVRDVTGTPMDFRTAHAIQDSLRMDDEQVRFGNGFDHNWILNTNGDDTQVCASLYSPKTGILLEAFTNEPGMQVYTGNFQGIDGEQDKVRKGGLKYPQRPSVCLESQKYPDSPNHPEWPSPYLNPGEKYYSHLVFKFSVK